METNTRYPGCLRAVVMLNIIFYHHVTLSENTQWPVDRLIRLVSSHAHPVCYLRHLTQGQRKSASARLGSSALRVEQVFRSWFPTSQNTQSSMSKICYPGRLRNHIVRPSRVNRHRFYSWCLWKEEETFCWTLVCYFGWCFSLNEYVCYEWCFL